MHRARTRDNKLGAGQEDASQLEMRSRGLQSSPKIATGPVVMGRMVKSTVLVSL